MDRNLNDEVLNEQIETYSTVIIGAGMAGISAAVNLLENGHNDILIVEALDRIGGRIHTIQEGADNHIELGAQWIHGQVNNPLFDYACQNKLLVDGYEEIGQTFSEEFQNLSQMFNKNDSKHWLTEPNLKNDEEIFFVTSDGQQIDGKLAACLYSIANNVFDKMADVKLSDETMSSDDDKRLSDVVYEEYVKDVKEMLGSAIDEHEIRRLADMIFECRCGLEKLNTSCSNLDDLSFKNFSSYKTCNGNLYTELKHGYRSLLDSLIKRHQDKFYASLRLNYRLETIYVSPKQLVKSNSFVHKSNIHSKYCSNENQVVLRLSDMSSEKKRERVIVCDRVLCTMSLGFLKANLNRLFEPLGLIDSKKRQAIARVGYGTINKVYMFYDNIDNVTSFWNNGEFIDINFCWTDNGARLTRLSNDLAWLRTTPSCSNFKNRSDCLVFWFFGHDVESVGEVHLSVELTRLLRQFLNNPNIPEPTRVIRSSWHKQPLFKGTYTYMPIGSYVSDLKTLARPLPCEQNPLVLFAGEHTHESFYSTVHGAYLSGLRESNRILDS